MRMAMALSYFGWLNGIMAFGIFAFGCGFGIYIIINSRRINANLLTYLGVAIFCSGWAYTNVAFDFLSVLLTSRNLIFNSYLIVNIFAWSALPIAFVLYFYIGSKLITSEKWKYFFIPFFIIGAFGEIFIIFDHLGSFNIVYPPKIGEDLIYNEIYPFSPVFFLTIIAVALLLIFNVAGFLYKSIKLEGIVRKKYASLSLGFFLYLFFGSFEVFPLIYFAKFLFRIGVITGLFLFYLGLREEPEKSEKVKPEKDIKVAESIFRITKRPEHLTEEEVSVAIEKRICLVCKGKLERKMYICPNCGTFYCEKCSDALSDLENMCWVCDTPFDVSKPVKKMEEKEEEITFEKK